MSQFETISITTDARGEGDKLAAMLMRTRGGKRQHHWMASFPSVIGHSRIDAVIAQSDACRWFYDCPRCNVSACWTPSRVVWPKGEPSKAVVECEFCGGTFTDEERRASIFETGKWIDRDGEPVTPGETPGERYGRRRGYSLSAMAHIGAHADKFANYMHEIAAARENAEAAENPQKALRVYTNTICAESYEEEGGAKADAGELEEGREHYDPSIELPDEVTRIFAGADVNNDFIALQVWGFGATDAYALGYHRIDGRFDENKVWAELSRRLAKRYRHPLGVELMSSMCYLDSRFKTTGKDGDSFSGVLKWASKQDRVRPVMGSPAKGAPALGAIGKNPKTKIRFWNIGSAALKETVYDWLAPEVETRMTVHFTDACDDNGKVMFDSEYFAGLLSESREEVMFQGHLVPVFTHERGVDPPNEPLDTAAYAVAAWMADKRTHEAARRQLEERAEAAKGAKPAKKQLKRGSFSLRPPRWEL